MTTEKRLAAIRRLEGLLLATYSRDLLGGCYPARYIHMMDLVTRLAGLTNTTREKAVAYYQDRARREAGVLAS